MFTAGQTIDSSIMHRKQGTFSYKKNSPQMKDLGNNLYIKTEKMTNDVARVYFIDNQGNPTQPPASTVFTCSSTEQLGQLRHNINEQVKLKKEALLPYRNPS
ncbi:10828_t:CDS:2 [Funneliformis caledonium]|uniref:10828_t:CDS:1 n=1 Tax=Funneliformis caledonium TaxID=1117310 RepID=A0A9N9HH40_9GLOM|nr:10828_t:CDS:2 [Funneliformis caledonium]